MRTIPFSLILRQILARGELNEPRTTTPDISVVAISHGPTPYYTPILNELSRRVRLHVVYMGSGSVPDAVAGWGDFQDVWGEPPAFPHTFHKSVPIRVGQFDFAARLSAGISQTLRRLRPDVVLVHSWGPLMIEPLVWAHATGRRSVMWTESSARTGLLRDRVSMFVRRRIVSMADAFLATGALARQFIIDLGADPQRVVTSPLPSPLAGAIEAIVRHAHIIGPVVRLELGRRDTGELFEAELRKERYHELKLQPGDLVFVTFRNLRVFVTDYSI